MAARHYPAVNEPTVSSATEAVRDDTAILWESPAYVFIMGEQNCVVYRAEGSESVSKSGRTATTGKWRLDWAKNFTSIVNIGVNGFE